MVREHHHSCAHARVDQFRCRPRLEERLVLIHECTASALAQPHTTLRRSSWLVARSNGSLRLVLVPEPCVGFASLGVGVPWIHPPVLFPGLLGAFLGYVQRFPSDGSPRSNRKGIQSSRWLDTDRRARSGSTHDKGKRRSDRT